MHIDSSSESGQLPIFSASILTHPSISELIQNQYPSLRPFYDHLLTIFSNKSLDQRSPDHVRQLFTAAVEDLYFHPKPSSSSVCGKQVKTYYQCHDCMKGNDFLYCQECFQYENHQGHMFDFIEDGITGYCDCGNVSLFKEQVFCNQHKNIKPLKLTLPEMYEVTQKELLIVISMGMSIAFNYHFKMKRTQEALMESLAQLLAKLSKNSLYYQKSLSEVLLSYPHQLFLKQRQPIVKLIMEHHWTSLCFQQLSQLFLNLTHQVKVGKQLMLTMLKNISTKGDSFQVQIKEFIWQGLLERQIVEALVEPDNIKYMFITEATTSFNIACFYCRLYQKIYGFFPDLFLKMILEMLKDNPLEKWLKVFNLINTTIRHRNTVQDKFESNIKSVFNVLNLNKTYLNSQDWKNIFNLGIEAFKLTVCPYARKDLFMIIGRIFVLSFLTYYNFQINSTEEIATNIKPFITFDDYNCPIRFIIKYISRVSLQINNLNNQHKVPISTYTVSLDYCLFSLLTQVFENESIGVKIIPTILDQFKNFYQARNQTLTQRTNFVDRCRDVLTIMNSFLFVKTNKIPLIIVKNSFDQNSHQKQIITFYRELANIYPQRNKPQLKQATSHYIENRKYLKQFMTNDFMKIRKGDIKVYKTYNQIPFSGHLCPKQSTDQKINRLRMRLSSQPAKIMTYSTFSLKQIQYVIQITEEAILYAANRRSTIVNLYFTLLFDMYLQTRLKIVQQTFHRLIDNTESRNVFQWDNRYIVEGYQEVLMMKEAEKKAQETSEEKQQTVKLSKVERLRLKKQEKMRQLKAKQSRIISEHTGMDKNTIKNEDEVCIVCHLGSQEEHLYYLCHTNQSKVLMKSMLNSKQSFMLFTTCGHLIHNSCLINNLGRQASYQESHKCFLCKKKSNLLLPFNCDIIDQTYIKQLSQNLIAIVFLQNEKENQNRDLFHKKRVILDLSFEFIGEQLYKSIYYQIYLYFLTDSRLFRRSMLPIIPQLFEIVKKSFKLQQLQDKIELQFIKENNHEKKLATRIQTNIQNILEGNISYLTEENIEKYFHQQNIQAIDQLFEQIVTKKNQSEQYIKQYQCFERFNIFVPPVDLVDLKRMASLCTSCQKPTNILYKCLLCQEQTCEKCTTKWKSHIAKNHKGETISIRISDGVVTFQNYSINQQENSLYKNYLGEPYKTSKGKVEYGDFELDIRSYQSHVENIIFDSISQNVDIEQRVVRAREVWGWG